MAVTDFSIQHLVKIDPQQACSLTLRELPCSTEQYAHSLLSEFKRIQASRAGRLYGCFDTEHPACKALLQQWREGQIPFNRLAQQLARQLALVLDSEEALFSGYLFFLAEQLERGDRLFIFQLRQNSALTLNQALELSEMEYIEFSDAGFGVAIDLSAVEADAERAITLSFGRGDRQLKQAINHWLGFKETVDKRADTEQFLALVDTYCSSLPQEEAQPMRERVVDYCVEQEKAGETVRYESLADEVGSGLERYLREHQPQPRDELVPDRKQLRNYQRFVGRSSELSISFSSASLGNEVEFDPQQEVLMIRHLPKSLLEQLKKMHQAD